MNLSMVQTATCFNMKNKLITLKEAKERDIRIPHQIKELKLDDNILGTCEPFKIMGDVCYSFQPVYVTDDDGELHFIKKL